MPGRERLGVTKGQRNALWQENELRLDQCALQWNQQNKGHWQALPSNMEKERSYDLRVVTICYETKNPGPLVATHCHFERRTTELFV